jgi:penicillin-binding protein 1C
MGASKQLTRCKRQVFRRLKQATLILMAMALTWRFLPYIFPIYATNLTQERQSIEFVSRQMLPLGTLLTQSQEQTAIVPLSQVSSHFIHAIIAAEDGQYYQHGALEIRAIGRSTIEAIRARKLVSGASTITMQLARMLEPHPRNLRGKSQEIWLAWRLAAGMNKNEILHAYINRLPMGGNIYGVEAAAQIYFGVPARDLNLAQASILAALPNDPTDLNPYTYWQKLKKRQAYVLDRMVKDGYISRAQSDRAYVEKIALQPRQQGIIAAPHFLFWLASQLPKNHPSQIRTTIDRPLQQFVEAQARQVVRNLAAHNAHHAAALVVDNHSGEVLAYVGSPDYFSLTDMGRNDGVQALRQPGSTLKPFLYQLALENRVIRPNTVLADVPTNYAIGGAKLYSPRDYSESFQGPVRVRVALANSLNIPAVRVLEKVGVPNFLSRLQQLGFTQLNHPADYYGLGLTLGSGEVSLWELARAYVTMARHGQGIPLVTTTLAQPTSSIPVASPTWELVTDILSDRHARARSFGVDSVLSLPFPTAVKTGTSSDYRDTWTVGFSADYTVATWVGNFNGEPMKQVSGVMGAAPLWNRIMLHLHEDKEPAEFAPPTGLVQRPVCALSGLKPTPACPTVVQEYFYPQDLGEYDRHYDTFYRQVNGVSRLDLPSEYNEWLALQQQPVTTDGLKIVSPRSGDNFLVYPNSPPQKLSMKLAVLPEQPVEWWMNGEKLIDSADSEVFWALRPGSWVLEVRSKGKSDRVNFQVELAGSQATRRGFSVAPN